MKQHKYLYFDEFQLKEKTDGLKKRDNIRYEAIVRKAEVLLQQDFYSEDYANSVYSQHGRFYELGEQLTDMAETLGFIYAVEKRQDCAEKLLAAMKHYAGFRAWAGPSNKDRTTPWKSELTTTKLLYGMAVGFDYLHDYISEEQRKKLADAICKNGVIPILEDWVLPGSRIHALDSMGHNWWSVCISFAGIALCVLKDYISEYRDWMPLIINSLKEFCTYSGNVIFNKIPNFDSSCFFYESIRYFNYGVGELLRFEYILSRLGDEDEKTVFLPHDKLSKAFLMLSYPAGNRILWAPFGDSSDSDNNSQLPCYLLLSGNLPDDTRYFMKRCYQQSTGNFTGTDIIYDDILWDKPEPTAHELPKVMISQESGCGSLRNSWEDNQTMFAVRCGYTWNHAHDDAGSFVLYDRGMPLLIDSGSCPYEDKLYLTYFTAKQAHSVVLAEDCDGRSENMYYGSKFSGLLARLDTLPGFEILRADSAGPFCNIYRRNFRHFVFLNDEITVVTDDIRSFSAHKFIWQLHYNGDIHFNGNTAEISNSVSKISVYAVYPQDCKMELSEGYSYLKDKNENSQGNNDNTYPCCVQRKYLCIQYPDVTDNAHFLNILMLNGASESEVLSLSGDEWCGAKITYKSKVYEIFYNFRADGRCMHINSNHSFDGWQTDAYMLIIRRSAQKTEWQIVCGSYLRRGDISIYESYTKKDAYGEI